MRRTRGLPLVSDAELLQVKLFLLFSPFLRARESNSCNGIFTGRFYMHGDIYVDKVLSFWNRSVDTWNTCDKRHVDRLSLYQEPYFIWAAPAAPVLAVVSSALVSQYLAYWQLLAFSNLPRPFLHNNLQDTDKTQHLIGSRHTRRRRGIVYFRERSWLMMERQLFFLSKI